MSQGVFKQVNELAGHLHRNVLRMLHAAKRGEEHGSWWLAQAGGFDVAVCAAAADAGAELQTLRDPRWGSLHATQLEHPLTGALGFAPGSFLSLPGVRLGGDANTPCQVACRSLADMSAASTHVSARVLFDMADVAHRAYVSTPLGTCEVAGSAHRGDTTDTWARGEYDPIRWDMDEIRRHTKYTTTFF